MNRLRRKKTGVLAMTAVLTLAAACSQTSGGDAGSQGAAAPQAGTKEETKEAAKPALKALHHWMKDDYNTYPVAKVIEEETGYKVQYDMLPQDKSEDKLNLIMASGEAYDYIFTVGGSSWKALYSDYAKRGALVDLGPLLEEHGPNIKASLSQRSWDMVTVDGNIYAIPFPSVEFVGASLAIRQDWLDLLGLPMPTTIDEFKSVLAAFKEKDPGGNGDQNIPMTINGDAPMVTNLVGAFGIANGWNPKDGALVPQPMDRGFPAYLTYMNELFAEGLLEKEFAVNKDATMKEKFSSGRTGVIPLHWADVPAVSDALQKNDPNAKIVFVPPLKGPDGQAALASNGGGLDRITFIPKSAKNAAETIKFINAKLETETFKRIAIGDEGTHYTFENGAYSPILPIFNDERNQANNYLTGVDENNYATYWQARVRKDPRLFAAWESINPLLDDALKAPDVLSTAPYLPEFARNNQTLGALVSEFAVKIIVGSETLDGLEAFQQKFNASGGEATAKEINDWYASK
ncbi:extracellular solute-binding protein [Paenibacillus antri]|uniref:Extracellular solute-binding protein n=1 Tax=Paenibacillus antri TaxID=2582848 RepID=A0A5R9GGP3_9BACL|nr:extracellular solute-binding protein [Paenibacillus antri]TLS51913.1 extracellular solute-binding protein [Paenibacillus antri]